MLSHLVILCGIIGLAACVASGGADPPGVCVLRLSEQADGFAVKGEVGGTGAAEWVLSAMSHDGGVRILQSGTLSAPGVAGDVRLTGRPDGYNLGLTVTRGGETVVCPLRVE
jgi:hypothetical protein